MIKRLSIIALIFGLLCANETLLARCGCCQKKPILYDYNKQAVDPREGKHLYPIRKRCHCSKHKCNQDRSISPSETR